jgi:hypothetical protein
MFTDRLTFFKFMAIIVAVATALTACASTSSSGGAYSASRARTPAEAQVREESEAFDRSSMEACLVVGGGAALLALLLSDGNRQRNAIIAAMAGCGVGVGTNQYIQGRRSQYANDEQRLRAMIRDVQADNARLGRLVAASRQVIDADLRQIETVDEAYRKRQISLAEARDRLRSVDANRAHLNRTLASVRERERRWRQVADSERRRSRPRSIEAMDREIDRLAAKAQGLEQELEVLAERRTISPIG